MDLRLGEPAVRAGVGPGAVAQSRIPRRRLVQSLVFLPWAVPTFWWGWTGSGYSIPWSAPCPLAVRAPITHDANNLLSDPNLALIGRSWQPCGGGYLSLRSPAWRHCSRYRRICTRPPPSTAPVCSSISLDHAAAARAHDRHQHPAAHDLGANFADLIIVMTNGGPAIPPDVASYISRVAFRRLDFGYASAIATALLLLLFLYAIAILLLRRASCGDRPETHDAPSALLDRALLSLEPVRAVRAVPAVLAAQGGTDAEALLYSEGIRLWPSHASLEHFRFVLAHSDFPLFFRNSLIVSTSTAVLATLVSSAAAMACRGSASEANRRWSR